MRSGNLSALTSEADVGDVPVLASGLCNDVNSDDNSKSGIKLQSIRCMLKLVIPETDLLTFCPLSFDRIALLTYYYLNIAINQGEHMRKLCRRLSQWDCVGLF